MFGLMSYLWGAKFSNMALIRVSKEFNFEMAHALWHYDGQCKYIHGHSYKLIVTIIGNNITDQTHPKQGMVIDFGDLKKLVNQHIISVFDHALVLKGEGANFDKSHEAFGNLIEVDYQPTCENMVVDFALRLKAQLPTNVTLHHVKLYETATSYAEWYASDN